MAEGKFYWLKLKKDFFKRHDIQIIEAMPNGKDYVLFYLKLLVESIDHEGELRFSETIPYNADMLATITNTNVDIVRTAMKVFAEFGMVEVLEDKTIYMAEVHKLIGSAVDNDNANRQRRFRESKKEQALLPRYASVTKSNESKSIEIEKELEIEKDKKRTRFAPPSHEDVAAYIAEKGYRMDADAFIDFYASKDWMIGRNKMKDWKAAVRNWHRRDSQERKSKKVKTAPSEEHGYDMDELRRRAKE